MRSPTPDDLVVPALKVHQWLTDWDKVAFAKTSHRRKPQPHFYLFTLPAAWLKALSGIRRRTAQIGQLRSADLGIQRRHDHERSDEIRDFVRYGFPWSELSELKRQSGDFDDLRKPGWLPTAIVVNILQPDDSRKNLTVAARDAMNVTDSGRASAKINLPRSFSGSTWVPENLHPMEVIDGQHRLWAFEGDRMAEDFELPVIAFYGLDISWQAYLFWTINIRPKKINASLAFDLYPLLRMEDWLEKFEGHSIYRETRAQELTEALWAILESPWYGRINMLGEAGLKQPMVSQAAWIRSLLATFIKSWEGKRSVGGLFGARVSDNEEVLPWSRAQQAAFLIFAGRALRDAIKRTKGNWAKALRSAVGAQPQMFEANEDPAFYGPHSLLTTDQGIRGLLYAVNDTCYVRAEQLKLTAWISEDSAEASNEGAVRHALKALQDQPVAKFVNEIAESLSKYDWRTSSAPNLTEQERIRKAALRGSGGYRELRRDLLQQMSIEQKGVGAAAREVVLALGY